MTNTGKFAIIYQKRILSRTGKVFKKHSHSIQIMYKPVFVKKKTANALSVKEFCSSSCFSVPNDQVTTEMQSQCRHVPQSIKLVSTASLPIFFLNKTFWEVSSYSTIHPKCTSAYLILDCTNGRTVVIYRSKVHIIHIYFSIGTDIYLYIQEAPVSYAWNSQGLLCTLRRSAIFSGAQPLIIWLKEVIVCPVRTILNVLQYHVRTSKTHLTQMTFEFECHHNSHTQIWQHHTPLLQDQLPGIFLFCSSLNSPTDQKKEKRKWLGFTQICNSVLCLLICLFEA